MVDKRAHRKKIKHYHRPGDLHELTFSCYQRLPLLEDDRRMRQLSRCLDEACLEAQFQLVAFVFMPEHVHLLVDPLIAEPEIGRFLARVKQPFSKQVKDNLLTHDPELRKTLTVQERPGKFCFRFWQEGPGYDRNLTEPQTIVAAIDYLHLNPVRRGLVAQAIDWKWSSARWYLDDPPRQHFEDLPTIHGPRFGTFR